MLDIGFSDLSSAEGAPEVTGDLVDERQCASAIQRRGKFQYGHGFPFRLMVSPPEAVQTLVQRQKRMPPERDDNGFLFRRQNAGARLLCTVVGLTPKRFASALTLF